jgi:hypothetical protein
MATNPKIKQIIVEYETIQKEIALRNKEIKPLRNRMNELKVEIENYLVSTQQKGVKMGETVIVREEINKKGRPLSKKEKEEVACEFLRNNGIEDLDNRNVVKNFFDSLRKPDEVKTNLKIQPLAKYEKSIRQRK